MVTHEKTEPEGIPIRPDLSKLKVVQGYFMVVVSGTGS